MQGQSSDQSQDKVRLLCSVAEQLRVSLATMNAQAEICSMASEVSDQDFDILRQHSAVALNLVDGYLLAATKLSGQTHMELEPVSLSAVLSDVGNQLQSFGKLYNARITVRIDGRYGPVMANREAVRQAFLSLGYALLSGSARDDGQLSLTLALHKTDHGVTAGLYSNEAYDFVSEDWSRAQKADTHTPRPLRSISGSGAGLFVADNLMRSMTSELQTGVYKRKKGFAATFSQSKQLAFV